LYQNVRKVIWPGAAAWWSLSAASYQICFNDRTIELEGYAMMKKAIDFVLDEEQQRDMEYKVYAMVKRAIDFVRAVLASYRLARNVNRLLVFRLMIEERLNDDPADITWKTFANVLDWLREEHPRWGTDFLSLSEAELGLRKTNMLIELGEELLYESPEPDTATAS
jgi:hypothetical protein